MVKSGIGLNEEMISSVLMPTAVNLSKGTLIATNCREQESESNPTRKQTKQILSSIVGCFPFVFMLHASARSCLCCQKDQNCAKYKIRHK